MNIVIPKIKITILAGRRTLCAIKLSSINGDAALLSIITNKANDTIDNKANETTVICVEDEFSLLLIPMYVRASKKEAIVTAKAMAPFRSILLALFALALRCFQEYLVLGGPELMEVCDSALLSRINLLITTQRIMATGIMERNVACHPKLLIILPPTAKPTTDPAANIELNTPTPIASFSFGN
jgi:hypothetical protein